MRISTVSILLFLITLEACGRQPQDRRAAAERVDSAGIHLITNRGPDRPLALTFTPRFTLGGKDEGPESFFRVSRGSVSIDGAGNIYVLDLEAKSVSIFDSTGKFTRTLGRPGGGPGELEVPNTVRASSRGEVAVYDFSKDGVVRWAPDGTVLPSTRIKATNPVQDIAFLDEGVVYSWTNYSREDTVQRTVLHLERPDSVEELAIVRRPQPNMLAFKGCGIMMRLPPLFAPDVVWGTNGTRIASVSGVGYEIAVRDPGGRRSIIRRDIAPQKTTLDLAKREVGDSMRIRGGTLRCAVGPEEVAASRGFAPVMPAIRTLIVAPDGAVWAQRMAPRLDPAGIDVFTADGDYRGTLSAGSPMPLAFFPNGDIAAMQKDKENDVERVVVYRVSEGKPR